MTICAVDIGGTHTKLGAVNPGGAVRGFTRIPTAGPAEAFSTRLRSAIGVILQNEPAAQAIGVSVAGFLDPAHSVMIYNPNIQWLELFPLQRTLEAAFDLPVRLEVDSNAAALGEYHAGDGGGVRRFLCLTVGTGIGGGFLIGGEPVRFAGECLGDVGHIIVEPGGAACTCGGRGCAEAVAAAGAIAAAYGRPGARLETVAADPGSDTLFVHAGRQIGLLAASLASIFFPDRIVLGGGVAEASPSVTAAARESFAASASAHARAHTVIAPAHLGARAALVGAAFAAQLFTAR